MAGLLETWFLDSVVNQNGRKSEALTPQETDILMFATRDIAKRSKRVADMVGSLPR